MAHLWIMALVVAMLALTAGCGALTPDTQESFTSSVPDQRICDPARMLTSHQTTALEARTADIQRTGVPLVLYSRQPNTTADETVRHAQSLMSASTVESPSGAHESSVERIASILARVPLTVTALLYALLVAVLSWGTRHLRQRVPSAPTATTPPDTLAPAIVGALVAGRIKPAQMDATVLDMARHGALAIEPDGARHIQIRLLRHRSVQGELAEAVWQTLSRVAYGGPLVPGRDMQKLRMRWRYAQRILHDDLIARGWYDPTAGRRRRILYSTAGIGFALMAASAAVSIIAGEPQGILGTAILLIAATIALIRGYSMPETTPEGAKAAAPWRGYLVGLQAAAHEHDMALDLDTAVPYAVALGVGGLLNERLRRASQKGYAPAWFGQGTSEIWGAHGFFPYWTTFHAITTTPVSSASREASTIPGRDAAIERF